MSNVLIDRISAIVFHNGVLRVDCISIGPNNEERKSGTLLVPALQVTNFINTLSQGTQELSKRLQESAQHQAQVADKAEGGAGKA